MATIVQTRITTDVTDAKPITKSVKFHATTSGGSVEASSENSIFDGKPVVRISKKSHGQLSRLDQYMNPADAKFFGQGLIELAEGMGA